MIMAGYYHFAFLLHFINYYLLFPLQLFLSTAIIPAAVVFFIALYRYRNRTKIYTNVENHISGHDALNYTRDVIGQKDKTTMQEISGPERATPASKSTKSSKSDSESCDERTLGGINKSTDSTDFIQFSQPFSPTLSTAAFNLPTASSSYDRVISVHDPLLSFSYGRVPSFRDPISSTYGFDFFYHYTIGSSVDPPQYDCTIYSHTLSPSYSRICFGSSVDPKSFSPSGHAYAVGDFIRSGSFSLKILDILGQGGQATIYQVQHGNSLYAAKISNLDSPSEDLKYEFDIMSALSHPNIASVFQEIPRGFLLEYLMEDLFSLIERVGPPPPYARDHISLGIAQAVSYLHSLGIAHLDIKPHNVLMTACGNPKLADFGLAMRFRNEDGSVLYLGDFHGSFEFAPPEMFLLTSPIDMLKSDCWSMGVTFFFMLSGHLPFEFSSQEELLSNQLNGNYSLNGILKLRIKNDPVYSRFMGMVKALCNVDPKTRFSTSETLSFYWNQDH